MKVYTTLLALCLALPASALAQPKAVDLVGIFVFPNGTGTATELNTGCNYTIDGISTFPGSMEF
jgi:hypothetical protein